MLQPMFYCTCVLYTDRKFVLMMLWLCPMGHYSPLIDSVQTICILQPAAKGRTLESKTWESRTQLSSTLLYSFRPWETQKISRCTAEWYGHLATGNRLLSITQSTHLIVQPTNFPFALISQTSKQLLQTSVLQSDTESLGYRLLSIR